MARKKTLSPSKITTYLACPNKYNWTYLDPRGKWYLRSKSYYSFGTSLHNVLQRFHDEGDKGVTTVAEAVAAAEESWIDAGYDSQEEMAQALAEGKEILSKHIEEVLAQPATAKTLFVEKMMRCDLGEFVLIGRMDRIDELDDGTIEVVDYKSGRTSVTPDQIEGDIAMGSYQILLREHYPDRNVIASIIALRTNEKASYGLSDEEAELFKNDLVFLGNEILNREFDEIAPVAKDLCYSCDFLPLCKKHSDFDLPEKELEN